MFIWNKVNLRLRVNDINSKSKLAVKGTKLLLHKLISIQTPNLKVAQLYKMKNPLQLQAFRKPETKTRLKEELKCLLAPYEAFPNIIDKYTLKKPVSLSTKALVKAKYLQVNHQSFNKRIHQALWLNKGNNNQSMYEVLSKTNRRDFCSFRPEMDYHPQPLDKGARSQRNLNRSISTRHYFLNYTPITKKLKINRSQLVNVDTTFDLSQFLKQTHSKISSQHKQS